MFTDTVAGNNRYSIGTHYTWSISQTDRNSMMSAHEDVHDVWGQIIWRRSHVIAGVKMLYFEKQ